MMSRPAKKRSNIWKASGGKGRRKAAAAKAQPLTIPSGDAKERYFVFFVAAVLLVFGAYQSIQYFGHQVVPNSDFPAFVRTGKALLAFELPASFKRAPILGLLQAALSHAVADQHPDLTAGWLLNSILHPFSLLLLYLIARKILDGAAWLYAIIVVVNPWTVALLVQPLAETTMIFFILLTVYFILRRSNWCYLFASIATMTRYECASLILGAFVFDIIIRKTKKERFTAFLYAALASMPLGLWLLATKLTWQPGVTRHYFGHFTSPRGHIGTEYFRWFWETAFMPLLQLPASVKAVFVQRPATTAEAASIAEAVKALSSFSKFIAVTGCLVAIPYSLIKRQWKFVPLIIFFACYVGIHSMRALTRHRYCLPAVWVALLLFCYGWQSICRMVNWKNWIPRLVIILLQLTVVVLAGIWLVMLVPHLSAAAPVSPTSRYLPYIAASVIALIFAVRTFVYKTKYVWRDAALSMLACLMVVSGQFMLVRQVGSGKTDVEFKMLADWYVKNAQPGEKLAATLTNVMRFYAPKQSKYFVPMETVGADDATKFVLKCYKKGIRYVAWDSRIGLSPTNSYYKKWGIDRIAMLARPQSIGPYEFITQLKYSDTRFINLFRLRKPDTDRIQAEPDAQSDPKPAG
jgi:hypothetical protein